MSDDLLSESCVRATVREALSQDPLAEVEEATGLPYDKTPALGLRHAAAVNERKRAILSALDDTRHGLPFEETRRIARELGFVEVLEERFAGKYGIGELLVVAWMPSGFLLVLESFTWGMESKPSTNTARLYFNAANGMPVYRMSVSGGLHESGAFVGDRDVREGLRFFLAELEAEGCAPMNPWVQRPLLWLATYTEKDGDFVAITEKRVARLPAEVRAMLGPAR